MSDAVLGERLEPTRTLRPDLIAFAAVFAVGCALYAILRSLGVPQSIITLSLIVTMAVYAYAAAKVPRLRVRLDQGGDNAYYLGLLYTLISMAWALVDFGRSIDDPTDEAARRIIGSFGIALGTTIAGIFLRLLLHQMRIDPAEVENMTRIELSEATKRVRATLDDVSHEMGRHFEEVRQRTGDHLSVLVEGATASLKAFADLTTDAAESVVTAASKVQEQALGASSRVSSKISEAVDALETVVGKLRGIEVPPQRFAARLNDAADALSRVSADAGNVHRSFVEAGNASGAASQLLSSAAEEIRKTGEAASHTNAETLERISATVDRLKDLLASFASALEHDTALLGNLEEQNARTAASAQAAQEAAGNVLKRLADLSSHLADVLEADGKRSL